MIILALICHYIGHRLPTILFKKQITEIRGSFGWKPVVLQLSGSLFNLTLVLIIVLTIGINTEERYLPIENLIYGVQCSPEAKQLGFKDGDKIVSLNSTQVTRFDEIIYKIYAESGDTQFEVVRGDNKILITISDDQKTNLLRRRVPFVPRERLDNGVNTVKRLEYTQSSTSVYKSFESLVHTVGRFIRYFYIRFRDGLYAPFISVPYPNMFNWFHFFSVNLVLIILINLLPIPGLDGGNVIISLIENANQKKYDSRLLKVIKTINVSLIIAAIGWVIWSEFWWMVRV